MGGCCEIGDLDDVFGPARAESDAKRYLRRGLGGDARRIADTLVARGVAGHAVLEVGGGSAPGSWTASSDGTATS